MTIYQNERTSRSVVIPILNWYERNKRILPWRKTRNPYRIWIAEIMLQQTRVEQAIPYYKRFLKRFPTIKDLAASNIDDVLKIWEGLGYYRRARYILEAAIIIVKKYDAKIPNEYEILSRLPGFGPYTCGSVLSIAYNKSYPAVDGNVTRLMSRIFKIQLDTTQLATKRKIENLVANLIPVDAASKFSQALMDMGAMICKPVLPNCEICCCRKICRAYNEMSNPAILPKKKKKSRGPHFHIAAGIVRKGKAILLSKRPANIILGGLWEFPGGKKEKNESLRITCLREVRAKTGISIKLDKPFGSFKHHYSHYSVTLHFFCCTYVKGTPSISTVKWVKISNLETYAFSKIHKKVALKIRDEGCR